MGIQINGNNDIISALDGSWTAEGASINTSGILTATTFKGNVTGTACTFVDGNFTGNVTVGGTLTYEDVTNIDSVGLITARGGIVAQDDVTFTTANSNNILFDKSDNLLRFGDNVLARFGNDNDLEMYHTGSTGYIKNTTGTLYIQDDSNIIIGSVTGSETGAKYIKDGAYELYHNNILKLATDLDGIRIGSGGGDNTIVDLHNASYDNGVIQYYNGSINLKTGTSNGDRQISLSTAGDERFKIESTGRTFIKTDESTTGLIVQNTVHDSQLRIEASAANKNSIIQFADGADGDVGMIDYDHNDNSLAFTVNTGEKLRIKSDGDIGIGTDTIPGDSKLHLWDSSTSNYRPMVIDSAATNGSTLVYRQLGTQVISIGSGGGNNLSGSSVTHGLIRSEVATVFAVGNSEKLRIKSTGEVRIGANSTTASTAGDDLVIEGSSDRGISIISGSGSSANIYFGDSSDTDIGRIAYQHNDNALDFSTNAAGTVLRIQSDGNLRWYPDGSSGVNMYLHSNNANAITYAVYKNGSVATTCAFKNQNSSGQAKTWMEVNGSQQISIPYGMGGTDYFNIYVGADITKGINIMGQDGGNQNSDSGKIHFNGYAQTNGPWIWGENTLAWGKKDLVFGTVSTTNDYTTEVGETLRMTKYGDISLGISPNDTLWDSNNDENGMYYRRSQGSFAMATRSSTGYSNWYMNKNTTGGNSDNRYIDFYWNNQTRGSITNSGGSSTSYNTSSDYRLKENIVDITDGITRLKQLKPRRFNWIHDSTNTIQDGFIAHEVSSFIPEAVTGTKDRVVTQAEVDADTQPQNDAAGTPVYQQMDYAKVTPLLTAALQELIAKVETLEAKVAALESS